MKLVFFDTKKYDKKSFNKANTFGHEIAYTTRRLKDETIYKAEGAEGVVAFVNCDGDKEILKKLKDMGIKYWFQRSAGYNNIDLEAAKEFGIKVFRVPNYSPEAVSEFAMTLLMAINRNIHISYQRTTHKDFSLDGLQGETISGSTIGVIGAGRIGQAFIKAAKGLNTNVIVYDEYSHTNFPELADELGFEYVNKDTIFKKSDYLSLHCPSTEQTKQIVRKENLDLMKNNAIIVNTARGDLINTEDLLDALDHGKIRGVGLDVYEHEKGLFFYNKSNDLVPDISLSRLRAHRNVIMTSHQAFFTNLALKQIAETTMQNVEDVIKEDFSKALQIQEDGKILNG